ncbi:MAG: PIN domain-containing protein [Streptosporangiaceae bacterium]
MIIFDTSALFGLSPDDSKFDLLRALKRSGQQRVSIPWMVREELVAQRVLRHAEAHSAAVSATRDLNRVAPWVREREPKPFNRSEASDHWRQAYERLFELIETSGNVARQALLREANCEKPAKGPDAKDKGGARDAAIWLSVVEYLKSNPDEKVHFVTANTRDFGDGNGFPAPMAEDVEGAEDRLALLTSFDSVVSAFSVPLEIDEEHIQSELVGLLTSEAALTLLRDAVRELLAAEPGSWGGNAMSFLPGLGPGETYPPVHWSTWAGKPKAVLRRVQDVAGHKIGEDAWYTAIVDWILVGMATVPSASSTPLVPHTVSVPTYIACQWRTKLLFSSRPGEPPTLLQYWPPESLAAAEQDEWQPLVRKAVPQFTTPQFPDIPSGSPLALAFLAAFVIMEFARKRREGSTTANSGNLFDALGDTPEDDDLPG